MFWKLLFIKFKKIYYLIDKKINLEDKFDSLLSKDIKYKNMIFSFLNVFSILDKN